MMEKQLPQNINAEEGVLGSILLDPEAIVEVSPILTATDFYRDAHRTIYEAMLRLYVQHEPADLITLSDELERENKLRDIGGTSYLASLVNGVPTSGNVYHYASIVALKAEHRRRIEIAGKIAALSYEEADDAQNQSEQLLSSIGQRGHGADFTSIGDILLECMNDFDTLKTQPGSITGVSTGYDGIDKLLGGLQSSDLIILAARPGVGKTTLAQNIAYNAMLSDNLRIAFFSLEMSKKQLAYRFIAMDSEVNAYRIRTGAIQEEDEWKKVSDSLGVLSEGNLWIDDTAGLDVDVMRSRVRRLHNKQPIDLIIVDYLQQLHASIDGKRHHIREQEVSEVARKLKQVARELNIPVLALAQLNREGTGVPELHHLRESGQLEQEADIVMFIHQPEGMKDMLDVLVRKHRNGPRGEVRLGFEAAFTRFYNIDEQGRRV